MSGSVLGSGRSYQGEAWGEKAGVAKTCKIQENVKGGGRLWNKDILGNHSKP